MSTDDLFGHGLFLGLAGFQGGDDILRCGDSAEGVVPLLGGLALQEHRGVARVRDGVLDVVALMSRPA